MSDASQRPPESQEPGRHRFVPSGVNAQSWIGFEQRIQERRYKALLESTANAIGRGDAIAARIAFEEARELRPDAVELADIADRLAMLPMAVPGEAAANHFRSRTLNAVGLLCVGVALMIAIDWARPGGPPAPASAVPVAPLTDAAEMQNAASEPEPAEAASAPADQIVESVPPSPSAAAIGTVGIRPAIAVNRPLVIAPPPAAAFQPSLRPEAVLTPATLTPATLTPVPRGEVPDDYVAPQARRETAVVLPQPIAPEPAADTSIPARIGREPLAAMVRPPSVSSLPLVRETPAAAAAAAIIPREDENRVASVLNQYARAYGQLDASAARQVWPSVNERALARAFASLESQNVSFDNCSIDVRGQTANASCRGSASYVGKIGSRQQRTEARHWEFALRLDGEAWKIESAQTSIVQ
jgi:hypothetical protein